MRGGEAVKGLMSMMALSMFVVTKYWTGGDGEGPRPTPISALSQPSPVSFLSAPPRFSAVPTLAHPPVLCFCVSVTPTRHGLVDTTSQKPKRSNVFLSLGLCPSFPCSPLRNCRVIPPWPVPPPP